MNIAQMQCAKCGGDIPPAAKFCPSCGEPRGRICVGCGASCAPEVRFCPACGTRLAPADARGPPLGVATAAPGTEFGWTEAERRQLSILLADLVDSLPLSRSLDAEEFGAWMGRYHALCTRSVAKYEGYLARFIGDGVLAFFGYPHAHEDDAERAIRAGLEIIAELPSITPAGADAVQARVGIATGPVIVGMIAR